MKKSIIIATLIIFTVFFSYQYWDRPSDDEVRQAQSWLKKYGYKYSIEELRKIVMLEFNYKHYGSEKIINIEGGEFKNLLYLQNLRNLSLGSMKISRKDLNYIVKHPTIEVLNIHNIQIKDEDFKIISGMKNLERLKIESFPIMKSSRNHCLITNNGFKHVKKLVKLKNLILTDVLISEVDFENLKYLEELKSLHITLPTLDRKSLTTIFNLKKLEFLSFSKTKIVDSTIPLKFEKSKVRNLGLISCSLKDNFLRNLSTLYSLEVLYLDNDYSLSTRDPEKYAILKNNIAGQGLKYLGSLKKLYSLHVSYNENFGTEGIKYLTKLEKLKTIEAHNTSLDDNAIPYFQQMKNLNHLIISGSKITKEGSERLKDKWNKDYFN